MSGLEAREWLAQCARGPDCMAATNGMLKATGDIANANGFTDLEGNLIEQINPESHKTVQRIIQHVHRKHEKYKARHRAHHAGKPVQPAEFLEILTEDHDSSRPGALSHAFMGNSENTYAEEEFVQRFTRPVEEVLIQAKGPKTNIAGAIGKETSRHCAGNTPDCNESYKKDGIKSVFDPDKAQFDTLKLMCAAQGIYGLVSEIQGFVDNKKKQKRNPDFQRTSKKQKGGVYKAKPVKPMKKPSKLGEAASKVKEACDIDCGKSGKDFFVEVSRSVCR